MLGEIQGQSRLPGQQREEPELGERHVRRPWQHSVFDGGWSRRRRLWYAQGLHDSAIRRCSGLFTGEDQR